MRISDLDTPSVLIDLSRVEANLSRAQTQASRLGIDLRPHIKTHKLPRFALRQVELGATGITCQKLGEAEVMADHGLTEIFLPYNIVGAQKLARLKTLHARITLSVTADSAETVLGYAKCFSSENRLVTLVECDTGMGRCGVSSPDKALELARLIAMQPGLDFGGLMTYPASGQQAKAEVWLSDAKILLEGAGLAPRIISSGGTPDFHLLTANSVVTEYRPGTYIYYDRYQVAAGAADWDDCALSVLATIVSRPTPERAVLDAGSKTLSSDLLGLTGHGRIVGYPEAVITALSEEHGVVQAGAGATLPPIGTRVRIIPNHACVVSNLFDCVYLVEGDEVLGKETVAARGRVD